LFGTRIDSNSKDAFLAHLRLEKIGEQHHSFTQNKQITTIGFVFQTFNLLATMSAFENVELPMTILGKLKPAERKKRAKELLTCKYFQIYSFSFAHLISINK
jgi:putative ABC transport system ATP-binding protein